MRPRRKQIKKSLQDTVSYCSRFHEDTYSFLRDQAHVQKRSMNLILEECVLRYKKSLTTNDDVIS